MKSSPENNRFSAPAGNIAANDNQAEPKHRPVKLNAVERFIIKHTPQAVKNWLNRMIDKLPPKTASWIRRNRFLSICIVYSIRGLFFRPSMWAVYAAIAAWFKLHN